MHDLISTEAPDHPDDALRMFDADEILVASAPEARSARLARDLVERVRQLGARRVRHVGVSAYGAIAA